LKFLIIDNYDSFVYNIAQYLGELGVECEVIRNDKITLQQIKEKNYDAIIISPGPGTPEDKKYFGVCSEVIKDIGPHTPILGVCLGHQGIIHAFGGKVTNAGCVRHGKTSPVNHSNSKLFTDVKNPFRATRYHSLVGDKTIIPDVLQITATASDDGEIMAIEHKEYLIQGVQFHPESIMTEDGKKILSNFIKQVKDRKK
jgi:anthranilate synthase component 2